MGNSIKKLRVIFVLCMVATLLSVLYLNYPCASSLCIVPYYIKNWQQDRLHDLYSTEVQAVLDYMADPLSATNYPITSRYEQDEVAHPEDLMFNIEASDVLVFLHMQKTGGTLFGWHLVRNMDLERPCFCQEEYKRCDCFRPHSQEQWLFSRYSTGWKCGVHADWTELTNCVNQRLDQIEGTPKKRQYFYITILREPIHRYLSEYQHVKRGATWKYSKHLCNGRKPTHKELPSCYNGSSWKDVTIDSFLACPHNLAHNRQTRMLADLTLVGCYNGSFLNESDRNRIMLHSAKRNLAAMAFFGLTEVQHVSQYVFEETLKLRFTEPVAQPNTSFADWTLEQLTPAQFDRLREVNKLDIELYAYAVQLLGNRFRKLRERNDRFESHFIDMVSENRSLSRKDGLSDNKDRTFSVAPFLKDDEDSWLEDYLKNLDP